MNRCPSCGGVIGRDCFNPVECAAISSHNNSRDSYREGFSERYRQAKSESSCEIGKAIEWVSENKWWLNDEGKWQYRPFSKGITTAELVELFLKENKQP
jgi:hypothetical protein